MNPLPLVGAEFRRNALGSTAIVVLIALATALGITASAMERALREASTRAAARFDLVVGAAGSPTQLVLTTIFLQPAPLDLLPPGLLAAVEQMPGVATAAPVAVTDSYRGYSVVGTRAAFAGEPGIAEGRMFHSDTEAVVGADVRLPVGHTFRPAHGGASENVIETHDHAATITVTGRLAESGTPWDRAILVPVEALWAMHDITDGRVPAIVVKPRSVADAYRLRAKLRAPGTVALFPAEVLLPLYSLLGDVHAVLQAVAVAFVVLVISAVLLVVVAVLAGRRHGIAVLRALGASRGFIFTAVWLEGATLIGLGVVAGAVLALALLAGVGDYATLQSGVAVHPRLAGREWAMLGMLFAGGSLLATLPSLHAMAAEIGPNLRRSA